MWKRMPSTFESRKFIFKESIQNSQNVFRDARESSNDKIFLYCNVLGNLDPRHSLHPLLSDNIIITYLKGLLE